MRLHATRLCALATATALASATLAACSSSGSNNNNNNNSNNGHNPIVIGASLSLTGDFSTDGQAFERGYELWQSYVNSHGGLLGGRQVKLDITHCASNPPTAATNYPKLIRPNPDNPGLGPFSTLPTLPAPK